jgi:hypothetical protein
LVHARAGALRHTAAGVPPSSPKCLSPPTGRPSAQGAIIVSSTLPEKIPLGTIVRLAHRTLPLNSPPRAPRQCPHSSPRARMPIKGSPARPHVHSSPPVRHWCCRCEHASPLPPAAGQALRTPLWTLLELARSLVHPPCASARRIPSRGGRAAAVTPPPLTGATSGRATTANYSLVNPITHRATCWSPPAGELTPVGKGMVVNPRGRFVKKVPVCNSL